jgi:uncharacterized membrane protein YecN with MAPEG domain
MMQPPMPFITALYAGVAALILLLLAVRVSSLRRRLRIGLGDGGDPAMQRAVRAHANAVESALPVLLLMLIAELNRVGPLLLHASGIVLIVARLLHAAGLGRVPGLSFGRVWGIGLTWAVLAVLAVWNVWAFVRTFVV